MIEHVPLAVSSVLLLLQLTGFMQKAASYRHKSRHQVPSLPPANESACREAAEAVLKRLEEEKAEKSGSKDDGESLTVDEAESRLKVWLRAHRAEQNRIEWMPIGITMIALVHFFVHPAIAFVFALIYYYGSGLYFTGALKGGDGRIPGFYITVNLLKLMIATIGLGILHIVALELFRVDALKLIGARAALESFSELASGQWESIASSIVPANLRVASDEL